jgi:nicotinamidase-related amidase/type 1 glutamine amidotransferase
MNRTHWISLILFACCSSTYARSADEISLLLRYQRETSDGSGRFHQLVRQESWQADETAIIVCDVWDSHHCLNAVRRVHELGPRLNQLLQDARQRGMTVIHAPSDCMDAYNDHPARQRAINCPRAATLPKDIQLWCSSIPAEERGTYPIDQSDGGEDDDPAEHAQWEEELRQMGRDPGRPWNQQSDLITIDADRDFISDRGDEVWSILEHQGIRNVILTGVHTNMCVLGRPFGLRQMARNGKNVVLVRDMTDTMYNPASWPYVNHFTGTDLIVSHIERFVCPTITSDQFLGGDEFRFRHDARPHVAIVMADDEYESERTLPEFAANHLGKRFRVSYIFASDKNPNDVPGLDAMSKADAAVISVRRRTLVPEQLDIVKHFVEVGKPVVGLRTASHAFSLRGNSNPAPTGSATWPQFDAQVFGGNYTNHYGNDLSSIVTPLAAQANHPVLSGVTAEPFAQAGSLYKTSPLAPGTTVLLTGSVAGQPAEPVAWTFQRADGGRSFYTSMGHPGDFQNPHFVLLLANAIDWAAGLEAHGGH